MKETSSSIVTISIAFLRETCRERKNTLRLPTSNMMRRSFDPASPARI